MPNPEPNQEGLQPNDQEGQENLNNEGDNDNNNFLSNLKLSEEAKKQLESNQELLNAITHNITAKRDANSEAKKYREELEAMKKTQKDLESQKMKEQGEFKKLYEQSQKDIETMKLEIKNNTIKNKLQNLASVNNIKKMEYLKLFDVSKYEVNENMEIVGLEEDFKSFVNNNQELFTTQQNHINADINTIKPTITSNPSIQAEYDSLKEAAKSGRIRDLAKLVDFKKKHNLKKQ